MGIFLVTPLGKNADLVRQAVEKAVDEAEQYELPNSAGWLVSFPKTTVELSSLLGITGQPKGEPSPIGPTLVTSLVTYYGRGPGDMWEWLKTRFEAGT